MGKNTNYPSGGVYFKDMAVDDEDNVYKVGSFNFNSNFENYDTNNII